MICSKLIFMSIQISSKDSNLKNKVKDFLVKLYFFLYNLNTRIGFINQMEFLLCLFM